jgi:hypothetical protein
MIKVKGQVRIIAMNELPDIPYRFFDGQRHLRSCADAIRNFINNTTSYYTYIILYHHSTRA